MTDMNLSVGEIVMGKDPSDSLDELLLRQITPHIWVNDHGIPASHAFGPSTADQGMPSYSRDSKVTPKEAFDWHNAHARSKSVGTWACSLGEVHQAGAEAIDDSGVAVGRPVAPGHCYVDFRGLSKQERKDLRSQLLRFALNRGIVHPDSPVLPPE